MSQSGSDLFEASYLDQSKFSKFRQSACESEPAVSRFWTTDIVLEGPSTDSIHQE